MANALDAVLGLIAQEKQQEQFKSQQLTEAVNIFQRARESAQQNSIRKMIQDSSQAQQEIENSRRIKEDQNQELLRNAQIKALNAQVEAFGGGVNTGNNIDLGEFEKAGIPAEDIQMTPKQITYKGQQKTVLAPELKKEVSQTQSTDIATIDSTISDLKKNIENLDKYKIQSGPGYSTSSLPGADIYAQFTKSPEFNTWKSDTGRAFQKYRKWATGVAAGYPELRLITPNFPKADDRHDVYIAKAKSVIDDMNRNKEILLDYLNKSGYRTGALRDKNKDESSWTPEKEKRLQELRSKKGK